jgi:aspartyl aminopeptidase
LTDQVSSSVEEVGSSRLISHLVLRIPNLAIHLERQETFTPNKETHLFPIAGLATAELQRQEHLKQMKDETRDETKAEEQQQQEEEEEVFTPLKAVNQRHHFHLVELIAEDAGATPEDVVDFELVLYDTQKACLGGLANEFIFSARLDNLNQTFCAVRGLIESVSNSSALEDESSIRLIAAFDHEEIGSMTAQGAFSTMLPAIIRRLSVLPASSFAENESEQSYDNASQPDLATAYEQTLSSSFLLSADMAHAVNPNYGGKYESDHRPQINQGPVIKVNANARYATNSPGIALLQEVARKAAKGADDDLEGVPLQLFVIRNDSSCGSTIGPMLSAHLGARTLDLGNPQLAMHSIRETAGTADVYHAIRLFSSFFQHYSSLEKTILVD